MPQTKTSKGAKKTGRTAKPAPPKYGPRADKGEGENAIQARIKALAEPSKSILARLHPLVMKHASGLKATVRYGFAVYMRDGKMLLIAAPRKAYLSFGYTNDAGIDEDPIRLESPEEIDEDRVAAMVRRVSS